MKSQDGKTFDPKTLSEDLAEVRKIYHKFFQGLTEADWDRPVKGGPEEWTLHETVAHLCALNGEGLASIRATLDQKAYKFEGLSNRDQFNAYNRRGIEKHLHLSREDLCDEFLGVMQSASDLSRALSAAQAETTTNMPIYNRPTKIIEGLGIIMFHAGLHHSAQVAEPAGVPPLWRELSPAVRHRVIGRVMRALSLLYRKDLGKDLEAKIAFRVAGDGGGSWYVGVSPGDCSSGEGVINDPTLTIKLISTEIFCKMFTGRLNLPLALLLGHVKLRGDLRLFSRFGSLFSVDGH